MIRSLQSVLLGAAAVAVMATLPMACQSGGVGDPCTTEDESDAQFSGYDIKEAYIESRSFSCSTRICLVNHFQGRVTCPLGSPGKLPPKNCTDDPAVCTNGETCVRSAIHAPECNENSECEAFHGKCAEVGPTKKKMCVCDPAQKPIPGWGCRPMEGTTELVAQKFVCHLKGNCQTSESANADHIDADRSKDCCLPGSDTPVDTVVEPQCTTDTKRDANSTVYCSCRCGVADGSPAEPDFNFCSCPDGFSCELVRPNYNLGPAQLAGKYCVKSGTVYDAKTMSCISN